MRVLLTALLAFVTGGALVMAFEHRDPAGAIQAAAASAAQSTAPASATTLDADADNTEPGDNWPALAPSPEQVLYAQPAALQHALQRMTPRIPGKPNLYLVAFAGDGGEDVFRNEAEYAAKLFAQRYGSTAHSLVLENNPATLAAQPLASWSNLEAALKALAGVMDPSQDILMLYVSSHGDEDHNLLVDMDPLPLDQIGAPDLASILAEQPFKWKVVVVNACYSGGFIPAIKGAGTLVMTAARSDRSSFGCGSDSDITYFGRAWLVDGLNRTPDFIEAFDDARHEIATWEQQDRLTPSEPQIDIGSGIQAQLVRWREGIRVGPALPFKPAATADQGKTLSVKQ
jgi:hypothetical protein